MIDSISRSAYNFIQNNKEYIINPEKWKYTNIKKFKFLKTNTYSSEKLKLNTCKNYEIIVYNGSIHSMDLKLKNKVALVCAASEGLGKSAAMELTDITEGGLN